MGDAPLLFGRDAQLALRVVLQSRPGGGENLIRALAGCANQEHVPEPILICSVRRGKLDEHGRMAFPRSRLFVLRPPPLGTSSRRAGTLSDPAQRAEEVLVRRVVGPQREHAARVQ